MTQTAPQSPKDPPVLAITCATIHPESLTQQAVETTDKAIATFLELFTLLYSTQGSTAQARLERLATLPLRKCPILVIHIERPTLHIHVQRGQKFVVPSFSHPTPDEGKIVYLSCDIRDVQIHASVDIPDQCIKTQDILIQPHKNSRPPYWWHRKEPPPHGNTNRSHLPHTKRVNNANLPSCPPPQSPLPLPTERMCVPVLKSDGFRDGATRGSFLAMVTRTHLGAKQGRPSYQSNKH